MSNKRGMVTMCLGCAALVDQAVTGRWRDYCSSACRQRAYRHRVTKPALEQVIRNVRA